MKIGFSLGSAQLTRDHRAGFLRVLERGRAVNRAGLDSLTIGDHHSTPMPFYQNVPMIGRLMAEVDDDRPIGCLFLMPLWNPVLLAEQVGTLATMTSVPFIVQTGIGDGAAQAGAMGTTLATRGDDLDESLRIVKALWEGETVSSERFGIVDAQANPRPPDGIDLWIGGSATRALRRAAQLGDGWYTDARVTAERAGELLSRYRDQCDAAGTTPRSSVRVDVLILDDAEKATAAGDALIAKGYRGLPREAVAYGGVEQVVDQLGELKQMGFDEAALRCMARDQADALETIELCGEVKQALA